jgi:hypothetical protein
MLRRYAFASVVILSFVLLTTCGSSQSGGGLPIVAGSSKVSLTMGDTPPAGITVLSFQVTVTGAVLNSSGGNALLVSTPTTVELGQLLVETAYLNTANVRTGTYDSATFTFATPKLTVFNGSSAVIGACAVGAVCQLTPALTPGSVTYSVTPFPLAIGIDTPLGLSLDFDLNNSLQNDLSISPSVAVSQLTPSGADGQLEDENIVGSITAVDTTNNQFTLQNAVTGLYLTYKVDSNTLYTDFGAASLSSLAVGQVVEVDAHLLAGGTFLATRVSLKESSSEGMLEGTVTSVDSATQFKMVVYDEEPDIAGVAVVGNLVTVSIQPGASFEIDAHDLIIPIGLGLTFGSAGDLLVGQSVQVRPLAVAAGASGTTASTDRLRLRRSNLTARVFSKADPNFAADTLPSLFASASPAITQIQVQTSDQTTYQGVIGFTGLSTNDTISVRGLLLKNVTLGTPPTLVADKVRKR